MPQPVLSLPAGWKAEAIPVLKVPVFARLDEYVGVWAIDSERGAALWDMASRLDLVSHVAEPEARSSKVDVERIEVPGGRSIAVLRAEGVMMKQRSSIGRSTSTVELRRDIRNAVNDPEVGALLLAIDSPGGTVSGMEELAAEVRAARTKKPVYAQVEDLGASAAYWLGSQAEKIFAANKSTLVGSIGTLLTMYDLSGKAEKEGIKALVFATGNLKGTGTPGTPVTPEQQQYLQGIVDQSQAIFDDAVKGGRGFNDQQLATVRTGGVFLAGEAQTRGLIDGIQSFDATVQALAGRIAGNKPAASVAAKIPVSVSKSTNAGVSAMKTFEEFLTARGLVAENLSEERLAMHRSDWEALRQAQTTAEGAGPQTQTATATTTPTPIGGDGGSLMESRKAAAAELKRQGEIQRICAGQPLLAAQAIEEGWEPLKAENAMLKLTQRASGGPWLSTGSTSRDVNDDVVRAALCLRAGLRDPDKHFKPEVIEVAEKHCAGWGLQRTIIHYAMRNGWSGDIFAAFQPGNVGGLLRAAFSTIDLSNTLGGSAQKFARQGIRGTIGDIWRKFSAIGSVKDFRPTDGRNLVEANRYEEVGADGEIKHGTLSESSWTNRARSFAKMLSITFQDQKNDDLGFLSSAEKLLGRGASRSINYEWFTEFMDNSAFFTSGRGNYASGGGTALSATSLAVAEGMFKALTTEEGDEIDYEASYLFVPLAKDVTARELFKSTNWNTGGSSTSDRIASENIWAGKFEPVTAAQLSNSAFTGYSTTAWYLLANPMDAPVMEVVFLDGKEDPIIETAEADFNTLGIQMRGHIHYGVKLAEYRAGVKMAGA